MYITLETGTYYVTDEIDLIHFCWAKDYRPDQMYLWESLIFNQFVMRG